MILSPLLQSGNDPFPLATGLHLRSGLDPEKLAEVHGNTNKEICNGCGAVYMRAFRCREAKKAHDHRTSRKCCYCRATLSDVIVNFGESLPDRDISKGFSNSESARVALALGSSLTVSPAADMPLAAKVAGAKFAIVNLQRTPLDSRADVVTHASVDAFLGKLCEKLGVGVDDYLFSRPIEVRIVSDEKKHRRKESSPTRTPSSSKGQHSLTFRGALREVEYTAKRSSGSTDGRKAAMKGNDLVRLELRAPESEASDKALSAMLRRATFVPKTTEKQYGTDGADGWAVRVGYQEVVSQQVQVKLSTKLCPPEAGGEGDTTACEFTASLAKGANDVIARDCWEISFRRRHVAWHASRIPLEEGARWRSEVIVPPRNRQTSPFS